MEPRIGVFICRCGTNIGGVINVPDVMEYAKNLPNVVFVDEGRWICSVDYLLKLKKSITDNTLDRVVVACCTPRTHEAIFKNVLKEAGLNPYLLEFVSVREQCSWVHKGNPASATRKAKDIVKMGVAKAALLEPAEESRLPVGKDCLVIGGGIAGMTAALAVAEHGFNVILVEKEKELGGLLNRIDSLAPVEKGAGRIVEERSAQIARCRNITVLTNAQLRSVDGWVGNFKVDIEKDGKDKRYDVSTMIVATGMRETKPVGLYGYGGHANVVTQLRFEEMMKAGKLGDIKEVAIINCVNSMNSERGCCNIGCMNSIKDVRGLKKITEDIKVYLFYRDLSLRGTEIHYFDDATEKSDALVRFSDEKMPVVCKEHDGRLSVRAHDLLLGEEVKVNADLVVLQTAFQGDDTAKHLGEMLKVSTNQDSFFQEAHIKLRPLDFVTDGIYLCGCARSPKDVKESVEEGLGAAMRAVIPMTKGYVEAEGIIADIMLDRCIGCGTCAEVCPFKAIEIVDDKANLRKAICRGCGTCAVECPEGAIDIVHFTRKQLLAQVEAALSENPENKIVAFCCHWCALGAVDAAGLSKSEYPTNVRIIRVMCSGRVDPEFVRGAFKLGAGGVLIAGCEPQTCHYIRGVRKCSERMERLKKDLAEKGFDSSRLWTVWLSAAEGMKFVSTIKDMVKRLKLGEE